jgi:hypothetical protein
MLDHAATLTWTTVKAGPSYFSYYMEHWNIDANPAQKQNIGAQAAILDSGSPSGNDLTVLWNSGNTAQTGNTCLMVEFSFQTGMDI